MKILLTKDVFKLGRAGDIKVAAVYARNYLIHQGLAIRATAGAVKQAERIRIKAAEQRQALNEELKGLAEQISELRLLFAAKAGETDKLYGSITTQQIADRVAEETGYKIKRQDLETEPIRTLGKHIIAARLTMDLVPEFTVVVYREGEAAPSEESEEALEEVEAVEEEVEAEEVEEVEPANAEETEETEENIEEEVEEEAEPADEEKNED